MINQVKGHIRAEEYAEAFAVIDHRFKSPLRRSKIWKNTLEKIYTDCKTKMKKKP